MLKLFGRLAFVVIVLSNGPKLLAQNSVIELTPEFSNYNIGKKTTYFEDKSEDMSFEEILKDDIQSQFIPMKYDVLVAGIKTSSFWVKIRTKNVNPTTQSRWVLTLDYPPLDYITLYEKDLEGNWQTQMSGDRLAFNSRGVQHYKFAFPLAMPDTLERTYYLKVKTGGSVVIGVHIESEKYFVKDGLIGSIGYGIFIGALIIMLFYNLFLYFSLKDSSYFAYVLFILNNLVMQLCYSGHISQYVFPDNPDMANRMLPMAVALTPFTAVFFTIRFLNTNKYTPLVHKLLLFIGGFSIVNFFISAFFPAHTAGFPNSVNISLLLIAVIIAGVTNLIKGNKSARFFLLAWSFLVVGGLIVTLRSFGVNFPSFISRNGSMISSLIELVFLSIALADKYSIYKVEKDAAIHEIINLKENANKQLEKKVAERTAELNESLKNLTKTQDQLIQKEKLASLGELTAGIAHEIQNPLNFVNNFSELSDELVKEILEERQKSHDLQDHALQDEILQDIALNLDKIQHHGKRASGIVKGMLEHSKVSSGNAEVVDMNDLLEDYIRLSYHGMVAKNSDFEVEFVKVFDPSLPKLKLITQDIGRVILNLLNNAFYAVDLAKKNAESGNYKPTISITSQKQEQMLTVSVTDNGIGMSEKVRQKVFEPFFTTKPTGEGTGLGLSLSYDIITKGNAGRMTVESIEGKGSTFTIQLPLI